MKALTRKEAIMMSDESVVPMTREEAILAGVPVKAFTKDEYLRANAYVRQPIVNHNAEVIPEVPVVEDPPKDGE